MVKAIYFPINENQPREIQLAVKRIPAEESEPSYESVWGGIKQYTGADSFLEFLYVRVDGLNGPPLRGYQFVVAVRDAFLIDGSPVNQCVEYLMNKTAKRVWKGPIVVIRQEVTKPVSWVEEGRHEDLELSDIGPVLKYLQYHAS